MINLKELRVDNWVYNSYTKQNTQVYPMMIPQLHRLEKENGSLKNCNIEPIPLTEEILLKCGFYEDVSGFVQSFIISYWNNIRTVKTQFEIVLDDVNGPVGIFVSGNNVIYLRSLHQLQNLYFAITGQELKIEL